MKKTLHIFFALVVSSSFSLPNTWNALPAYGGALQRCLSAMVYLPDSNRFLLSMGSTDGYASPRYSEQVLSLSDSTWKNFFPEGKLGVWGGDTGPSSAPGFNGSYFTMTDVQGNTRPFLGNGTGSGKAYFQYAYDTDDGKIYYFTYTYMLRYDPHARVWELLSVPAGLGALFWGSLCYDPHNHEIVLFGGTCGISMGNPGTWTYTPATDTWAKLDLETQPAARLGSPMVYDAKNQKIILFSGDHRDSMMTDTWVYDVTDRTWTRKHPSISPSPRAGHAMLYLPKSQKVVMMGGFTQFNTQASNETEYAKLDSFEIWTYDGSDGAEGSWALIKHFNDANPVCMPGGLPYCLTAAADSGDRVIAIGAGPNYYRYEPITYYLECDPSQVDAGGTQTHGWKTDSTLVRGMRNDPAWYRLDDGTVDTAAQEEALRGLPENVWTLISQPKYPLPGQDFCTAVYSPDHDAIIRWGGGHANLCFNDVPQYSVSRNRWTIGYRPESSLEWYRNAGGPAPTFGGRPTLPSHTYDNYDYCPILKKVVYWDYRATWFYDPAKMDWDTLRIPPHPTMDTYMDYKRALNATPHGMVAQAPFNGDMWGPSFLWIMDTLTLAWKRLTMKGSEALPGLSDYCGMVYDGKCDRLIFSGRGLMGQLWEYRFSDSIQAKLNPVNQSIVPAMIEPRECAYLPDQDEVFFMDTATVNGTLGHLVYDCAANTWRTVAVTGANGFQWQNISWGWGVRYDARRKLILLTTESNQIYMLNFHDSASTTAADLKPGKGAGFSWQASPNPFTGSVAISLKGAHGAAPSLRIYDIRGKLVEDLTADMTASFRWDAGKLPSGLYAAQLQVGNKVYRKNLILAK